MQRRLPPGTFNGLARRSCRFADFILTEVSFPARFGVSSHHHDNAFFRLIIEGESTDVVGGRTCFGGASSMVYHPAGESHSNYWHCRGRCFVVEFAPRMVVRFPDLAAILRGRPDCESGPPVRLALKLYSEFRQMDVVSPLAMEGLALELIAESCRIPLQSERNGPPGWLQRVKEQLHDRFAENLSLHELAAPAGIHPTHLARAFRRHFRCTPGEYVRRLRVDYASQELARSETPLSEIALAAGFSDQSHFTAVFKRSLGLTPAAYRKIRRAR
jgi:AraC family transcriptional regulator